MRQEIKMLGYIGILTESTLGQAHLTFLYCFSRHMLGEAHTVLNMLMEAIYNNPYSGRRYQAATSLSKRTSSLPASSTSFFAFMRM